MVRTKGKEKYEKIDTNDDVEEQRDDKQISLQVKLPEDKSITIRVPAVITLKQLKEHISEETGIEISRQRLIHFGKLLTANEKTLQELSIKEGQFIHLMPLPTNVTPLPAQRVPTRNYRSGPIPDMDLEYLSEFRNFNTDEYFQGMELELWRARVRLLGSLMMFFYFLQSMGNLSLWLHPEEMDLRYEKNHHPSDTFFMIDLMEAFVGISASLSAMKAANSDSVRDSAFFLRNCLETAVFHFVAFVIYNKELLEGKIQMNPHFTYNKHHDVNNAVEQEALFMGVIFGFMVNLMIWWSILSIALKYHQSLVSRIPVEVEEESGEEEMASRELPEQIV